MVINLQKKYWTILIPELILDAQVRIYLEKKIALGINLIFCLILPKKKCLKLLIDACYCFNSSSLLSRFASPILEH